MAERLPTEKQTLRLSGLPVGWVVIGLGPKARDWLPLANHGWVEETTEYLEPSKGSRPSYRITPAGLRALASGLEKYGLPPHKDGER